MSREVAFLLSILSASKLTTPLVCFVVSDTKKRHMKEPRSSFASFGSLWGSTQQIIRFYVTLTSSSVIHESCLWSSSFSVDFVSKMLNHSCLSDVLISNILKILASPSPPPVSSAFCVYCQCYCLQATHHSWFHDPLINLPFQSCFLTVISRPWHFFPPTHPACTLLFTSLVHFPLLWMLGCRHLHLSTFTVIGN